MRYTEWLREAEKQLQNISSLPALEAERILEYVLQINKVQLMLLLQNEIDEVTQSTLNTILAQRLKNIPLAYLEKKKEFFGYEFFVNSHVLVPRPETELLIEKALELISKNYQKKEILFADIGTGSGCIAITLTLELIKRGYVTHGIAIDNSPEALGVAQKNAKIHTVENSIEFREGNLLEPLHENVDILISNPPYLDQDEWKNSPSIQAEPYQALVSEDHGYQALKEIIQACNKKNIALGLFEMGNNQSKTLIDYAEGFGYQCETFLDYQQVERFLIIQKPLK